MFNVLVQDGDITKVNSDALATAINSGGMWFGGIDGAIKRVAGSHYHNQASKASLEDGSVIVATGDGNTAFENVLFVVDDLQQPLNVLVSTILKEASKQGFKHITIPALRMGVMLGVVEKSKEEAVEEILLGMANARDSDCSVKDITFVIYNDFELIELIRKKVISS